MQQVYNWDAGTFLLVEVGTATTAGRQAPPEMSVKYGLVFGKTTSALAFTLQGDSPQQVAALLAAFVDTAGNGSNAPTGIGTRSGVE